MLLQEVNLLRELFYSLEVWGYLGPAAMVAAGYFITRRDRNLGVFWYVLICLFAATYLQMFGAEPGYIWHILILVFGGLSVCIAPAFSYQ